MGEESLFEMGSEQMRQLGSYGVPLGNGILPVLMTVSKPVLESSGKEVG